jgi:hypothetical protein
MLNHCAGVMMWIQDVSGHAQRPSRQSPTARLGMAAARTVLPPSRSDAIQVSGASISTPGQCASTSRLVGVVRHDARRRGAPCAPPATSPRTAVLPAANGRWDAPGIAVISPCRREPSAGLPAPPGHDAHACAVRRIMPTGATTSLPQHDR